MSRVRYLLVVLALPLLLAVACGTEEPTPTFMPTIAPTTPGASPTVVATPTGEPDGSPTPTDEFETPEPTETGEPDGTETPTATATGTPEPTETGEPFETPEPTETGEPFETLTPEPTETGLPFETLTPEPTETGEPFETLTPEATGTPTGTLDGTETPMVTGTPDGTPNADGALEADALVVPLRRQASEDLAGVAIFNRSDDQTEVALSIAAGAPQFAYIRVGSCGALGDVVHTLSAPSGGASTTTLDVNLDSLATGVYIVTLQDTSAAGADDPCGEVPASEEFITIELEEENDSTQNGIATLYDRGAQTEVVMTATPNIAEATHIHSGQCGDDLGSVVYPLENVDGGLSITMVDATLESLRTGDFAINLHQQGNPAVYTACGNIPGMDDGGLLP